MERIKAQREHDNFKLKTQEVNFVHLPLFLWWDLGGGVYLLWKPFEIKIVCLFLTPKAPLQSKRAGICNRRHAILRAAETL